MYFNLPTENKDLIITIIIISIIIIQDNYYRSIKTTYGQKLMSKLLIILNNTLIVKVVFPILATIKRHLHRR